MGCGVAARCVVKDTLVDTRWSFERSWGRIDVRIVDQGQLEYLELAAIAKAGCTPGPVAFQLHEMSDLLAVIRRVDELMNGHPKHRAKGELDPVLGGKTTT
jgi:hypothetical protein